MMKRQIFQFIMILHLEMTQLCRSCTLAPIGKVLAADVYVYLSQKNN